jgi:hypothetical protein
MSVQPVEGTKPNGPVAAAFIAAGTGCAVLGVVIVLQEAGILTAQLLDFSKNYGLGSGVGPLSGKVTIATIAFLLSWTVLGVLWRHREVDFRRAFIVALILVAIGFALTFPPIFEVFAQG